MGHLKKLGAVLCLAGLLLALCVEAGRYRSSHRKSKRDTGVHIEIYYPKGVMIWYPQRPGMKGFGIEVYLNQKDKIDDEAVCDICLNTTELTYGKYILKNDDVIIRGGDHLLYEAIKIKTNGSAYVMKSDEFYVAESRIRLLKSDCSGSSNKKSTVASLQEENDLLQNVISDLFQHCNNVTQASRNLFLNYSPISTEFSSQELQDMAKIVLQSLLPAIDWEDTLIRTFYFEQGVGLEVKTLVDKLKILQLSKRFTEFHIGDLDDMEVSGEANNEIDFEE